MRLPLLALFLISSRLFADAFASALCDGTLVTNSGGFSTSASCNGLSSSSASAQVGPSGRGASASAMMFTGAQFPTVQYTGANAAEDLVLLVSGGTGTGTYMMLAQGSRAGDPADTEYYLVTFGDAKIYGDATILPYSQLFGTFTYGVQQVVRLSIAVMLDARRPAGGQYSADASFSGIVIVQDSTSRTPVPDAVVSLQRTPEPSFSIAVGLCLLALAVRKIKTNA
jgi:hypothetical protein